MQTFLDFVNSLLTFSSLISEDFWVFLSFLCDRSVLLTSGKCAENTAIARKGEEVQKSSLTSKEKVNKVLCCLLCACLRGCFIPCKSFKQNSVGISAPQKNCVPPPQINQSPPKLTNSPILHRHPLGRTHPPSLKPPPSWDFSIKKPTPPPGASDSPFPSPEQKNKKISETSTKKRIRRL